MKLNLFAPALLSLLAASAPRLCTSFIPQQPHTTRPSFTPHLFTTTTTVRKLATPLHLSSSSSEESRKSSRLGGNARAPTPQEISVMDEMITKLADAKPYELPTAVSQAIRVVSSPQFFMRIAERADRSTNAEEKEKLSALATNLVSTLEAVVSMTEDKMDQKALDVEEVLKAASEPDSGEFLVPLSEERLVAMREKVGAMESSRLDEGFLVTVDQWMNKSMQDGMDGMVGILQKVLQMYASVEIGRARERLQVEVGAAVTGEDEKTVEEALAGKKMTPAAVLFEALLQMDTDEWDAKLKASLGETEEDVSKSALMGEVQRTIEGVVLGLENGSMTQRVQAEFLRELVTRIEKYD